MMLMCGGCVTGCIVISINAEKQEAARRAALTPEERQAEDNAKAAKKAAEEKQQKSRKRKVEASDTATEYLRKFLKHPHNASIDPQPTDDIVEFERSDGVTFYTVAGNVDAKNDFGAELTYDYVVTLSLRSNTWTLERITLDKKIIYDNPSGN
jgi:hypothetical protein